MVELSMLSLFWLSLAGENRRVEYTPSAESGANSRRYFPRLRA
jgi:hypothetical protein